MDNPHRAKRSQEVLHVCLTPKRIYLHPGTSAYYICSVWRGRSPEVLVRCSQVAVPGARCVAEARVSGHARFVLFVTPPITDASVPPTLPDSSTNASYGVDAFGAWSRSVFAAGV
ncbi:hypothetical protein BaRGS_00014047 [Batillaria attramentaria]|uniref:Uncharacterized protein n=1 Tax=Batillaria attramentaria TaxID=370345 RepID=A0ABD0L6H9_9CAEN